MPGSTTWTGPRLEQRLAEYLERFTGLRVPPGWARLDLFVSNLDPYPLGYVLASVRVAHWLRELEAGFGEHWWANSRAGEAISARIRQGGAVHFEPAWLDRGLFWTGSESLSSAQETWFWV